MLSHWHIKDHIDVGWQKQPTDQREQVFALNNNLYYAKQR